MPFMKGIAPIRRTAKYLDNCGLVFKAGLTQGIVTGQKMKTFPQSEPREDHDC